MSVKLLKFKETDNDNCRVYYQHERRWFCFQQTTRTEMELLVCTSDGEPSHRIEGPFGLDELPEDDCSTSALFLNWITRPEVARLYSLAKGAEAGPSPD